MFRDVYLLTVAKHIWDSGNRYMMTEEGEKDIRKAILQFKGIFPLDRGRKETKLGEGAWKKPIFLIEEGEHFFLRIDILWYTFFKDMGMIIIKGSLGI